MSLPSLHPTHRPTRARPTRLARRVRFLLRLALATVLIGGATLGSRAIDDAQAFHDHGRRIFASAWTWSSYRDRAEIKYSYEWLGKRYDGNAHVDLNDYPTVETAQLLPLVVIPQNPDQRMLGWSTYRIVERTRSFWYGWSIGLALLLEFATLALDWMTKRQRAALEEKVARIDTEDWKGQESSVRESLAGPAPLAGASVGRHEFKLAEIDQA